MEIITKKKEYTALTENEVQAVDSKIRTGIISDNLNGQDIALHFISLANSAFLTGRQDFIAILNDWIFTSPSGNLLHNAWALYSLLRTGFWAVAKSAINKLLDSDVGPEVIDLLVAGGRIAPDNTLMELPLPQNSLKKWQEFIANKRPWVPQAEQIAEIKKIFADYLEQLINDSGGGWDISASVKNQGSRALGSSLWDALELKPGMIGFRVDLKKLGKFWRTR